MITKPTIYTEEFVLEEVTKLLQDLLADKEVVYLGELFEARPYSRKRFSEWAKAFVDNIEISDTIARIQDILESRVNTGGLRKGLDSGMVKFNLINNYNWKDKSEVDQNVKGGLNLNLETKAAIDKAVDEL